MNESIICRIFQISIFCLLCLALNADSLDSHKTHNKSINLTITAKETLHLKCHLNSDEVKDNLVTWIRKRDGHILTNGFIKYINDSRFSPQFHRNDWILEIKNISKTDAGVYECGLTSASSGNMLPNTTTIYRLNVFDSKANRSELVNLLDLLDLGSDEQNTKIKEFLERAEHILRRAEDSSGNLNQAVIVNEFLPDPVVVKDFNISEQGGLTYFEGNLKNMTIHGLKKLQMTNMSFNLGLIHLKVVMNIPVISLQGIYEMDGKVTFFPFYGNGDFYMNITEIEINAYGSLNRRADGKIEVGEIELDVYTDNLDLHMDNLMGGGLMGGISNTLVNTMSGLIFNHIKDTLLDEVSTDIKKMINTQLAHLPLDFVSEKSTNVFDGILERAKQAINESGLDPLPLPPFRDSFDYKLLMFKLNGDLNVFDGYLSGLSSLVRTGDIIATYHNNEVVFQASMGFTNLTGGYKWATKVMGGGPSGSASLSLSSISCYLRIKQSLRKGEKPTISAFRIKEIKHLWIDVNGLGSWDFILEIIMNLVSNAFKLSLANAISGPVTDAIQKELNHLPLTFL